MDSPKKLKHKPIISVNDYDKIDGKYKNNSDAKALSLGVAQYDENEEEISLKVWRKVNSKWSRQSEELPIHRNLDLTILLLDTLNNIKNKNYNLNSFDTEIEKGKLNKIEDFYNNPLNKIEIDNRIETIRKKIDELNK